MKNFTLSFLGALALLFFVATAHAQSTGSESGEIVIIQKVEHEDGTFTTVKKRLQKGEDIGAIAEKFKNIDGKNVEIHVLSDGRKIELRGDKEEGETVFFFREAKAQGQEMDELSEEKEAVEKELEQMHIIIHDKDIENYDFSGHFNNMQWTQDESRVSRTRREEATKAFLGVYPGNSDDGLGVKLTGIVSGKGAEAAGMQQGDVLVSLAGMPTNGVYGLRGTLSRLQPGETVQAEILRDGQAMQLPVALGEKTYMRTVLNEDRDPCEVFIGVYVGGKAHIGKGVQVTGIIGNTPAEESRMEAGDIILSLDGVPVNDNAELLTERNRHEPGQEFRLTIQRGKEELTVDARFKSCEEEPVQEEVISEEATEPEIQMPDNTLQLERYNAFPNPSFGEVTLQFEAEAIPTEIMLSDASGRVIYRENLRNFDGYFNKELSLREAMPGNITLTIRQDDKLITKQLVLLNRA